MSETTLCRTLAAVLFFNAACCSAVAEIESFTESFSGTGDFESTDAAFSGLDNPGWAIGGIAGSEGSLTIDGLEFVSQSSRFGVGKRLVGQSGYRQELAFKNLSLDEVNIDAFGPTSTLSFHHFFVADELTSRVSVALAESPTVPDGLWYFVTQPFASERVEAFVPRSNDFLLSIEYDRQSSFLSVSYDPNNGDLPVVIGSPLDVDLSTDSIIELRVSNESTTVSGILESWTLMPTSNIEGDFDGSGDLGVGDIDLLSNAIRLGDPTFDLTDDGLVDEADRNFWVHDLAQTYFGDANLDGEFASSDLINVFTAGEYEDGIEGNSSWATGDWNGDADFTSSDLVLAFTDGGYEQGPRIAVVPEPSALVLVVMGTTLVACRRRASATAEVRRPSPTSVVARGRHYPRRCGSTARRRAPRQ